MKKMLFLISLLALGFSCNYYNKEAIYNDVPKIESIYSQEYTLENSDITIVLEKDRVYGFAGVNRYFGDAHIVGDKISITNVATTMMMGDENSMKEEDSYLSNLSRVNKIYISKNEIKLADGNSYLIFKKK